MTQPKRPAKPPNNQCPQGDDRDACPLSCKYNFFESDELTIHAWELKCSDCGWRETIGYRSDEEIDCDDPSQCPFCLRKDLPTGKNPCEQCS